MSEWHAEVTTTTPGNAEPFVIVEFLSETGSTESVPLKWTKNRRIGVVDDKKAVLGKCYWPPKNLSRKVRALAMKQVAPERDTWPIYDVELLQYCPSYEDSRKSLRSFSAQEDEGVGSDSSDDAPLNARSERVKRLSRRKDGGEGSSDSDEQTLDVAHLMSNHGKGSEQSSFSGFSYAMDTNASTSASAVEKGGMNHDDIANEFSSDDDVLHHDGTSENGFDFLENSQEEEETPSTRVQTPTSMGSRSPRKTTNVTGDKTLSPSKKADHSTPQKTSNVSGGTSKKARDAGKNTPQKKSATTGKRVATPLKATQTPQKMSTTSGERVKTPSKAREPGRRTPQKADSTHDRASAERETPKKSVGKTKMVSTPVKSAQRRSIAQDDGASVEKGEGVSIPNTPVKSVQKRGAQSPHPSPNQEKRSKNDYFPGLRRQSRMTSFVNTVSERELADINKDLADCLGLDSDASGTSASPSLSASPALSDGSDFFKTPRDKSTYRALNFGSPSSTAQGFRLVQQAIGDLDKKVQSLEKMANKAEASLTKILSCVLPPLESNIAENIPKLPMSTKEEERKMNDLLKNKEEFNKVVSFLFGLGGTSLRDAVFSVMKTLFVDSFAATKSMRGICRAGKEKKDAFMGTLLFKAVMCAVRRRWTESTVSEVIKLTADWLKDAPSRVKKRQRRAEAREQLEKEYDEEEDSS
ncbi:nucleolar protein dao-5-like [Frankliniella occidentalis]|uniref:Nucleolar protein dao-5-like n=1 Tax=Frankliniella occidentalis TaxID=133901 RepID=A0A9C6XAB0_FRAOC|nr:nucleolar protein dao-5-like [Frankliniella occidentalis]